MFYLFKQIFYVKFSLNCLFKNIATLSMGNFFKGGGGKGADESKGYSHRL